MINSQKQIDCIRRSFRPTYTFVWKASECTVCDLKYYHQYTECQMLYYNYCPNPYSAGMDFSRRNLTSIDVRFWRQKSIPAL